MTAHSLNIPARINSKRGNLSDFMAEVAALFWFETTKTLDMASPRLPISPLAPAAVASHHFKKWILTVLTTTQVTQNVAVLALLYIYRLKMANPTVKGRPGSEYRLLTVALMLANKFLDDNTYTNKTWADVSGISVAEIHVMEVEFLSNMRYSLLVSVDQWEEWLDRLTGFWSYLELAQQALSPSPSPLLIPSPTHRNFMSPLPSPTGPLQLTPTFQSTGHSRGTQPPHTTPFTSSGAPNWPYLGSNAVSPLALKPQGQQLYRKRSFPEEDTVEHPAKRIGRVPVGQGELAGHLPSQALLQHPPAGLQAQMAPQHLQSRSAPSVAADQGRLSVPSLTLNTAQSAAVVPVTQHQPYGAVAYAPPQASPLSLPPLVSGVRAMSTVFPTTTYAPSQPAPATCGAVTPTSSYAPRSYGTPTKRLSPQHVLATSTPYTGSSPLVDPRSNHMTPMGNAGSTSGFHTPVSHSPSIYLQQRNSPYKPVRHVNTLLYPPPSAFLQQYHLPNAVLPNQMHYRPLGKRTEYRTGIVPEFTYSGGNQHGLVTPAPHQAQALNLHQPQAPYQPQTLARAVPYQGQY
ncbi:hypothetical protein BT67DRAFT_387581 [Trichocladium antarcticum]|uniref:Cyclin n=1 Tax=Trichocladium antarcticum TaxID=1450529 RepID=A0AAN6UEX4_9PEZI|nr:hypothetical protein BT67DRAFT_387581 [Trichocladium antarcticum]